MSDLINTVYRCQRCGGDNAWKARSPTYTTITTCRRCVRPRQLLVRRLPSDALVRYVIRKRLKEVEWPTIAACARGLKTSQSNIRYWVKTNPNLFPWSGIGSSHAQHIHVRVDEFILRAFEQGRLSP